MHAGTGPAAAPATSAVRIQDLTKAYTTRDGVVEAVRAVSLAVEPGEFVALVGPSGCGKSTVLKIVAGLVPPTSGVVEVAGQEARAGLRDVGIMLQAPVLLPWRTIVDNVLLPAEVQGSGGVGEERAREMLTLVGLEGFESKYAWELSGGMQQRASLARLLACDPSILLMDEPFSALDEFTRERLNLELARIHEQLGRTVLYVTHHLREAVLLADRIVAMKPRPGEVVDVIDVDLPRPRSGEMVDSDRGAELMRRVRRTLFEPDEEEEG